MADAHGPREFSFDEAVDAAADAMRGGESLDRALGRFPQRARAMREPLSALQPVLAMPAAIASPASRAKAATAMFAALAAPPRRRLTLLAGFWPAFAAGHLRYKAAAAGLAVVLFGGIGFASAAGDASPVRVPGFLRVLSISSDNAIEFHGEILNVTADALALQTSSGERTIIIDAATAVRLGGAPATSADLAPGQSADVRATRDPDGALRATRINAVAAPATPAATIEPGLPPASDAQPAMPRKGDDDRKDQGAPGTARTPEPGDDRDEPATPQPGGEDDEHHAPSTGSATPGRDDGDEHEDRTQSPEPAKTATAAPGAHPSPTPEHPDDHEHDDHQGTETPEPWDH